MAATSQTRVLVCLGEHKREVKFSKNSEFEDAVFDVFGDILGRNGTVLLFQVKREGWDGEFVDLAEGDIIHNGAIIKAVVLEEVCIS